MRKCLWSDKGSKRHSDVLWRIVPGAWGTRKWVLGGGWDTTEPVVPWPVSQSRVYLCAMTTPVASRDCKHDGTQRLY
jgi:hypothetical protein